MTANNHDRDAIVSRTPALRRAMETLLGPLILKRHLPATSGGGVLFARGKVGGLKYVFKQAHQWDPPLLNIAALLVRKGSSVWDVGANVGLFSRAAAFHAGADGTILSIEADADAVALLNRTVRHHSANHADITVLPVAVSDAIGFVQFDIAVRARAANAIRGFGSTQTGGVKETRTLPCVTLDSMLDHFRAPDILKIDVEGAELDVLHGGRQIIERIRPAIYCETSDRTRLAASKLLEAQGYTLWDGDRFNGTKSSQVVSAATCNIVAIPQEKVDQVLSCND